MDGRTDRRTREDTFWHYAAKCVLLVLGAKLQISSDKEPFSTHFDHHSQWFFEM
jgi:hypothetical protein